MGEKIRTTINIDKDIWDLLALKLPCSRSSFFERMAREYLFGNNKLEELKEQKKEYELSISRIDLEIEKLEKLQEANTNDKTINDMAMQTVRKVAYNNDGQITESQIGFIANQHGIKPIAFKEKVLKQGIQIVKDEAVKTKNYHGGDFAKPF